MSGSAGDRTPKTLAEVSHLFFSNVEERRGSDGPSQASEGPARPSLGREPSGVAVERARGTKYFVVTGGGGRPGKSTVAVNLASAFLTRGRAVLIDADPRLPNARFFLGLPSWHYLSPVTGNGAPAPNLAVDSGLVVVDRSARGTTLDPDGSGEMMSIAVEGRGRQSADYAVFDLPIDRLRSCESITNRGAHFLVVCRPGWGGFVEAVGTLSVLRKQLGATRAGIVVNRAPDFEHATALHAKIGDAAQRLLSMETRLMGGVVFEPSLGSEQRERGAIVHSRPTAVSALSLREVASNALRLGEPDLGDGVAPVPREAGGAEQ